MLGERKQLKLEKVEENQAQNFNLALAGGTYYLLLLFFIIVIKEKTVFFMETNSLIWI